MASTYSLQSPARKEADITVDTALLAQAKGLKINVSQGAEAGFRQAITAAEADPWLAQNAAALDSSNTFFERQGLPLARFHHF